MASVLYARPSDNLIGSSTISLSVGAIDPLYPLINLYDNRPDIVSKTTGTTATVRAVFGSSKTLQGISLINHNLYGLTLTVTNNGGMASQNLVIPAIAEDNLPINPWLDLRSVANNSATQWEIAITGAAANIAIGEILLLETLRTLGVTWEVELEETHSIIEHRTDYDVSLIYSKGVRYRKFTGQAYLESDRASLTTLNRGSKGRFSPFLLIPDSSVNDSMLVRFAETSRTMSRHNPGFTDQPIVLEESCSGLAL
jgi:hypothetical protein